MATNLSAAGKQAHLDQIVGLAEIAELLEVDRNNLYQMRHHHRMPEPDAVLAVTDLWLLSTIQEWWGKR